MTNTMTYTLKKLFKYQLFFRTLKTVCVIVETSLQYVKAITLKIECVTLSMYKKLKLHAKNMFKFRHEIVLNVACYGRAKKALWADSESLDAGSLPSFGVHLGSQSAEGNWRGQYGERSNWTDDPTNSYVWWFIFTLDQSYIKITIMSFIENLSDIVKIYWWINVQSSFYHG